MDEPRMGWRPLQKPGRRLAPTPFSRLATTHVLAVAGDTLVTTALAGSLFFSISPNAARGRVALYLFLTMAPFAVVAPLIGPALDRSRGGRRLVVIASGVGRVIACLAMAEHVNGLLLFPEAFAVLVLSKTYMVTKSALVPAVVDDHEELVSANARLAILSVVAGFVAAGPAVAVLKIPFLGANWVLRLAAVVFLASAVSAARIPKLPVDPAAGGPHPEDAELRTAGIRLAATAMAVLRGVVGFMTFLVAFSFRRRGVPSWWFGLVIAASMIGTFLGAAVAPRLRRAFTEERMLTGALLLVAGTGLLAARFGNRPAASALAAAIGLGAGAGKLAFDSIVQRDAPDAARGRAFARFETRFQLVWVLSAAVPVLVSIPLDLGMGVIAFATAFAAFSYVGGRRAARRHGGAAEE